MAVTRARLISPPRILQARDAFLRARLPSVTGLDYDLSGSGDTATAADAATVTLTTGTTLKADTVTAADVAQLIATYAKAANDTGTAADVATVTLHPTTTLLSFADTTHPTDAKQPVVLSRAFFVTKDDTTSTADVFKVLNRLTFNDSATTADNLNGASAPSVHLAQPLSGSTNVSPDTPIVLQFTAGLGSSITAASIVVLVNSQTIWASNTPALGWTGAFTNPAPGENQLTLYPPVGLSYGVHMALQVTFNYTAS